MKTLWKRFVRWLARRELQQLQLQLAIATAENAILRLSYAMANCQNTILESIKAEAAEAKEVERLADHEDFEKKRILH